MSNTNTSSSFGSEFDSLVKKTNELGFDGVLYSFFPKPMYSNKEIQPVIHFSESFTDYIAHYFENDYGNHDFVLRLALQGRREPIDWWAEIKAGNVSDEERKVTEEAKHLFNIHHGLSIPVLFGTFAIAGISVIIKKDNLGSFQEIKHSSINELQTCAGNYHSTILKSNDKLQFFIYPLLESLSDTKRKVLKHLMSGQPMKTIPETHDISQRFAEKTLIKIRKEFGDISTNELLYILGMINMDEYL